MHVQVSGVVQQVYNKVYRIPATQNKKDPQYCHFLVLEEARVVQIRLCSTE